ncbi:MAG: permease [Gemmataceae bacterium]|nr:permease [Gemmataceae bacterium]
MTGCELPAPGGRTAIIPPPAFGGDPVKEILDFIITFSAVLWEAMPFIVLGAVIAGILEEFLPQQAITRFLPKQVVPAVMIGAVLGLVFPMCECGILVVMRRLLRKGLPLSCCVAYMLAGPIINLVVIFSTAVAFVPHGIGPEVVGLRVGLGFLVAVVTGLVVQGQWVKHGNSLLTAVAIPPAPKAKPGLSLKMAGGDADPPEDPPAPRQPFAKRLGNISATALHDFVDITVFLILGAVLAALAKQYITSKQIEQMSTQEPLLAIPLMMLMAVLMCLCSEADAFVAASFTEMHISAKTAFLVLGPMLDLKLLMMYTRVYRPRLIAVIVTCVVLQVLAYSFAVHLIYRMNGWTGMPG